MTGVMVPLAAQIAEVERELAMRRRVYPKWVTEGRMTATKATNQLAAMEAVLETLKAQPQGDLLG